jgi:predicted cupin superfamily sugar epimerase
MIDLNGKLTTIKAGRNPDNNEVLQIIIPKGFWFAAEVTVNNSFSLVGCTVSPGFDFEDFELARREELITKFPRHKSLIEKLTILT